MSQIWYFFRPTGLSVYKNDFSEFLAKVLRYVVVLIPVRTESHSVTDPWLNLNNDDGPREI